MKSYLFFLGFIIIQLFSANIFGQETRQATNGNQKQAADKSVVSGHFEIAKNNKEYGVTEHINVNYTLSPTPFTNLLTIDLHTPNPIFFKADIVDEKGNKLVHWEPTAKSYHYHESIDISKLPTGNYRVNIYAENDLALVHSISFEKGEAKN